MKQDNEHRPAYLRLYERLRGEIVRGDYPFGARMPAIPAGERADFPFSVLSRVMRRVISEYGEQLLEKSPNNGCDALRQAISRYLARSRGIRVKPGQIFVGSGAEYLYGLLVQLLGAQR